jgi:hypothetical protein
VILSDLFDLGALAVMDLPARKLMSRCGASWTLKGGFTDAYYTYDPYTGKYELQASAKLARDGALFSSRTNFWNNGGANDRGFLSVEAGGNIVKANPAAPADHIRADAPSGNAFTIQNTHATDKRGCGQNAGTSGTNSMVLSAFVKKVGGGAITTADVHWHMGTASGDWVDANNRCGATKVERFKGDWYRVSAVAPTDGATTSVAQGLKIAAGLTLYVEFGQHERFVTGHPGPTDPIATDVSGNTDRVRNQLVIEAFLGGGGGGVKHFKAGGLALAFLPELPNASQIFGALMQFGDANDHHSLTLSDSSDGIGMQSQVGGVSQAFAVGPAGGYTGHKPMGAAMMWGRNGGSGSEYFLAINGKGEGIITAVTSQPALNPARLFIGGRLDGTDVASSGANARILYAAILDKKIGRQNCCLISKRLQQYAKEFYLWQS